MFFPSAGCKVLLSLSVCSVSFSVAFYTCDLLYSLLRLSFGKQDQLPTPTWQWVTLAPIFGSFILYLLVNKIRVFCALLNETAYSRWRFSSFVVWFLAYYYILLKSSESWHSCTDCELIIVIRFCCISPITQVLIIGAFLMLCVRLIPWKKIGWAQITGAVDNNSFAKNEVVSVQVAGGPETMMNLWVF